MGKLGDLCTRQCDGCNIKGTVLPLRQPRRRSAIATASAASASPSSRGASGVAAAAAATAVTAITVQSLLAVAQRERGSF